MTQRIYGSRIRAFPWYQNHRPWMTLKGRPPKFALSELIVFFLIRLYIASLVVQHLWWSVNCAISWPTY